MTPFVLDFVDHIRFIGPVHVNESHMLSFFHRYDGLFLPYQDEWLNLGPINGGLAQYNVTYPMIDKYYADIQQAGFHSMSYFDVGTCFCFAFVVDFVIFC